MNILHNSSPVFSLALIVVLGSSALAGGIDDPRIRIVDLPVSSDVGFGNWIFSDDGSSVVTQVEPFRSQSLFRNRGDGWELVTQRTKTVSPEYTNGISNDGSALTITGDGHAYLAIDDHIIEAPRTWIGNDGEVIIEQGIFSTALSGDGTTVGLFGFDPAIGGVVSLIWRGGDALEPLGLGVPESGVSNFIVGFSDDASTITGYSSYTGRINDLRAYPYVQDAWVLADGVLTMIQVPNATGLDQTTRPLSISGDGSTIVGMSFSPIAAGGPFRHFQQLDYEYAYQDGWVWSAQSGGALIGDPARFREVYPIDLSADGSIVMVVTNGIDSADGGYYFWTRDGGFVSVTQLVDQMGILGPWDYFQPVELSDDGKTVMGILSLDGYDFNFAFIDLN